MYENNSSKIPYNSVAHLDYLVISDITRSYFELVDLSVLTSFVCLLGTASNIVNIIVFYRQGMRSAVNISFMALSITDLLNVILNLWVSISSYPILMYSPYIPINIGEVSYLTGGFPHGCLTRITAWITVYMTAERCVCIRWPFKVKSWITPRRTVIAITFICIINFVSFVPQYLFQYLDWKFVPEFNESRLGIVKYKERIDLDRKSIFIFSMMMLVSFVLVIVFTILLIIQLNRVTKWRKVSQSNTLAGRDKTVVRTVLVLACVLIVTFTPNLITCAINFIVPGFDMTGDYSNAFFVSMSFALLFDAINSSINTVLYYMMSSSFREVDVLYNGLNVNESDHFKNVITGIKYQRKLKNEQLDKTTGRREEWNLPVYETHFINNLGVNTIDAPAGILQFPVYFSRQPHTATFGSFGSRLGFHLHSAVDEYGQHYDKNGDYMDFDQSWWTNQSLTAYRLVENCVYDAYSQIKKTHMTPDEVEQIFHHYRVSVISWINGVRLALNGYKDWMKSLGTTEKLIPGLGLTNEQVLFLAHAQLFCYDKSDSWYNFLLQLGLPTRDVLVNFVSGQLPEFSDAFQCKPGENLLLRSEELLFNLVKSGSCSDSGRIQILNPIPAPIPAGSKNYNPVQP
ncbi:Endothelin-converting enzyme 2 [Bulinus truncatus]|nr:Endothelin-converting enzyme 2 [Bulinus truncatus]